MTKILVLYYSTWGHVETMAGAVAKGAAGVPGTEVVVKRVPELMPDEVASKIGAKLDQAAPVATPQELADYDGTIVLVSHDRDFLDRTVTSILAIEGD